jgi:Hemerythrin HHE cation binding domain
VADIIELILADHRRIRRLLDALAAAGRRDGIGSLGCHPGPVWHRVAELILLHTEAEQEICYLALFRGGPWAEAQWRDAIADHDDIRAALQETALQPAGSSAWWRAATAVLRLTRDHMDAEEHGILRSFARRASPELRHELAQRWVSFAAARIRDTARPARISATEIAQRPAVPGSGRGKYPAASIQ